MSQLDFIVQTFSPDDSTDMTPSSADSSVVADVAKTSAAAAVDAKRDVIDKSLQTDPFFVYPYEHLFPSVLPNMFSCHHGKVRLVLLLA